MSIVIMVGQLILGLSILVILHELGHFLAARAFGIKVEKFYLFFDAWNFSLFKFTYKGVEYGIGWLPLGGYVKIAGMIDESMDTEQLQGPPQPWEFRSKPAWQRLIVMLAGIFVNIVLGIFIFWMLTLKQGESYTPVANIKYGIVPGKIGLVGNAFIPILPKHGHARVFIRKRFVAAVHKIKVYILVGINAPAIYPKLFNRPDGVLNKESCKQGVALVYIGHHIGEPAIGRLSACRIGQL